MFDVYICVKYGLVCYYIISCLQISLGIICDITYQ